MPNSFKIIVLKPKDDTDLVTIAFVFALNILIFSSYYHQPRWSNQFSNVFLHVIKLFVSSFLSIIRYNVISLALIAQQHLHTLIHTSALSPYCALTASYLCPSFRILVNEERTRNPPTALSYYKNRDLNKSLLRHVQIVGTTTKDWQPATGNRSSKSRTKRVV